MYALWEYITQPHTTHWAQKKKKTCRRRTNSETEIFLPEPGCLLDIARYPPTLHWSCSEAGDGVRNVKYDNIFGITKSQSMKSFFLLKTLSCQLWTFKHICLIVKLNAIHDNTFLSKHCAKAFTIWSHDKGLCHPLQTTGGVSFSPAALPKPQKRTSAPSRCSSGALSNLTKLLYYLTSEISLYLTMKLYKILYI